MTIDAIEGTSGRYVTPQTKNPQQTMNSEVFLTLLVAQLRSQDPSAPMDTNQMIAQTVQLASMEQLTAMSKTSEEGFALQMRMAASGLVGKTVSYMDADGVTHSGIATSVSFDAKVPMVTIGDKKVRLDMISGVTDAAPAATPDVPPAENPAVTPPVETPPVETD